MFLCSKLLEVPKLFPFLSCWVCFCNCWEWSLEPRKQCW